MSLIGFMEKILSKQEIAWFTSWAFIYFLNVEVLLEYIVLQESSNATTCLCIETYLYMYCV